MEALLEFLTVDIRVALVAALPVTVAAGFRAARDALRERRSAASRGREFKTPDLASVR